jgi:hypothetical protein
MGKAGFPLRSNPAFYVLEITVEDLFEEAPKAAKSNRGPASTLEKQIEQISQLPMAKQKFMMEMLDTVIQQAS